MGRLNPEKKRYVPGRKKSKSWKRGEDKRDRSIISEAVPEQPADKVIPIKKKDVFKEPANPEGITKSVEPKKVSVSDRKEEISRNEEGEIMQDFKFPSEVIAGLVKAVGKDYIAGSIIEKFTDELHEKMKQKFLAGEEFDTGKLVQEKLGESPNWKELKEVYEEYMNVQNNPSEKLSTPAVGSSADKVETKPGAVETIQAPKEKKDTVKSTWSDLLGKYFFNKDGSWISPRLGKFKITDRMIILLSNKKEYAGDRTVSDLKKIVSEGGFTLSQEQYEKIAGSLKPAPAEETKPEPEKVETPPAAKENQSEFFSADELAIFEATAKDIAAQMEKEMTSAGKWEEYQKTGSLENDVGEFFQNIFMGEYNLNPQDAKKNANKILVKIFNK